MPGRLSRSEQLLTEIRDELRTLNGGTGDEAADDEVAAVSEPVEQPKTRSRSKKKEETQES